jgi:hypothetical protein
LALIVLVAITTAAGGASARSRGGCGGFEGGTCGAAATSAGDFHGLLAIGGAPWVIDDAAHDGTQAGCNDCSWSLVLACRPDAPGAPNQQGCTNRRGGCRRRQLSYRLYLSTDADANQLLGVVCIGGPDQPVPVGDIAKTDVDRYLRDVTPPDLVITTAPRDATLAGLRTSFSAQPPATLQPQPFGGPLVTETITIAPARASWHWGDGATTGWVATSATLAHSYLRGGLAHGALASRWGATYTITYAGQTFGPYDAVGQLTKRQQFTLPVRTSTPVLVSH